MGMRHEYGPGAAPPGHPGSYRDGPGHDENHIEDECFHDAFRSLARSMLEEHLFAKGYCNQ